MITPSIGACVMPLTVCGGLNPWPQWIVGTMSMHVVEMVLGCERRRVLDTVWPRDRSRSPASCRRSGDATAWST